ncbi:DUF7284 family protein [Haloarchaeobius iranensis]|uniref:DUF7284 family protein n=1 Tax=Haloarchaeobius iranensis TaxID=996166 RepID=UPI0011135BCE|nr:hypothetical protein [Haloarchaeobius iranensis]
MSPAAGNGDGRAVSTVLDVAVCLLFVTAAVGVLATADRPAPDDSNSADRAASLLGTTTATVHYATAGGGGTAPERATVACRPATGETRPDGCRTAHGTVADLLARAAVADVADNESTGPSRFEQGVRNATRQRLAGIQASWQVVVTWRGYPDAPLGGRVAVGGGPPPGIDVHTATLRVPVADGPARAGTDGDAMTVDAVGRRAASATVTRLFPPEPTRLALVAGSPADRRTAGRYRRTAATLGVGLDGALADGSVRRANDILVGALAARYARDLDARTGTASDAAALVSVETATVTVRTWSA